MSTEAKHASTNAQIDARIAGEKSSLPALVLLAGWLVPGLGHLILRKGWRALALFAAIVTMLAFGLALQGKIYAPNTGEPLDILGFVADLGGGLFYILTRIFGWGNAPVLITTADYGTKFIVVGCLLNLIAAVDAHSLANGRKPS